MTVILIKVIGALLRVLSAAHKADELVLSITFHPGMMEWVSHRVQSWHGFQWKHICFKLV